MAAAAPKSSKLCWPQSAASPLQRGEAPTLVKQGPGLRGAQGRVEAEDALLQETHKEPGTHAHPNVGQVAALHTHLLDVHVARGRADNPLSSIDVPKDQSGMVAPWLRGVLHVRPVTLAETHGRPAARANSFRFAIGLRPPGDLSAGAWGERPHLHLELRAARPPKRKPTTRQRRPATSTAQ